MFNFLKRKNWWKRLTRKLYEHAHPYKTPIKWVLHYNGYSVTIMDLSHLGDYDNIKIIDGDEFNNGRTFSYSFENGRRLTVQYVLNEYNYLPTPIKNRMAEILENFLDIPNEEMDKLIEKTEYFFGPEEL